MRLIKINLFLIIFLLISVSSAYAETIVTDWIYATDYINSDGFTNPSNALVRDGNTADKLTSSLGDFTWRTFNTTTLPGNGTITKLEIRFHVQSNSSSMTSEFKDTGGTNRCFISGSTNGTYTPNGSAVEDKIVTYTNASACLNWLNSNRISLNAGAYQVRTFRALGNCTTCKYDDVAVRFTYTLPEPSVTVNTSVASSSASLAFLNLSGDTTTRSAQMTCNVQLFERCTRSGYASFDSDSPVAQIKLIGSSTATSTKDLGQGYYEGYWSDASATTWNANNVGVPLRTSYNCDYPMVLQCTQRECTTTWIDGEPHQVCGDTIVVKEKQSVSTNSIFYDATFVATPSATQNTQGGIEPDCNNELFCWLKNGIVNGIAGLFLPSHELNTLYVSEFKSNIQKRAPISYAVQIFSFDLSAPTSNTSLPAIAFATGDVNGITNYDWVPPDFMAGTITTLRNVLKIVVWLCFVTYLFFLVRRIFL